ncbi:hypothetical protein [Streptomyces sp. SP17KL33]|uniref:hypothetical protein n=1 Tax=Streptomyces sp. SP17KL33 TaxID=3002534 RepID=UPI002E79E019|nr:hypothetical protein [Streptomyces sp. SP17KL33]MEE1832490.1 hypothetical protein [Streptomyces sp. SP17KL33]
MVAGRISWRAMPADSPGWDRVYAFFRRWCEHGLIAGFHDRLRGKVREREGREAEPTAGIIDAQSLRAPRRCRPPHAATTGEDRGPRAAHRDRHHRSAPGRRGLRREHRRPGRRRRPADPAAPPAPKARGRPPAEPFLRRLAAWSF